MSTLRSTRRTRQRGTRQRASRQRGTRQRGTRQRASRQRATLKQSGGMPLSYFTGEFDTQLVNSTGQNYNYVTDSIARPELPQTAGARKQDGGFYPSVMGPFATNAARIAVPLAAVAASHYLGMPPYFSKAKASGKRINKRTRTSKRTRANKRNRTNKRTGK